MGYVILNGTGRRVIVNDEFGVIYKELAHLSYYSGIFLEIAFKIIKTLV
jgi:hypothetical protein